MRFHQVNEFIRHIAVLYLLILEALYPFDSLPVSEKVKGILSSHAHTLSYWLAIFSNLFILAFGVALVTMTFGRAVFAVVFYFKPTLRQKLAERRKAKMLKRQQALEARGLDPKPSKCMVWTRLVCYMISSVSLVVNDAIFNRVTGEGVSEMDAAKERFFEVFDFSLSILSLQMAILFGFVLLMSVIRTARKLWRGRRQAIALDDEESRPAAEIEGMQEVEREVVLGQEGASTLDEKLIDFSDKFDTISQKVQSAMEKERKEEPLVQL